MLKLSGTNRQRAATLLMAVLCLVVFSQAVVIAQNLGAAPQVNVAVQGQTGAQPEGAFLNLVKLDRRCHWLQRPCSRGETKVTTFSSFSRKLGCS